MDSLAPPQPCVPVEIKPPNPRWTARDIIVAHLADDGKSLLDRLRRGVSRGKRSQPPAEAAIHLFDHGGTGGNQDGSRLRVMLCLQ